MKTTDLTSTEPDFLPLLICGVAGVAGYNGFRHFRRRFGERVIGQRGEKTWRLDDEGIYGINVDDGDAIRALIRDHGIRTIWNTGGSCALKACELDPPMAHRVNVEGVQCLLDAIKGTDIRLVHHSIDLVYSGTGTGDHLETDPVDPVTVYGKTMVKAEQLILNERPDALILRISLPMGISFNGHAGAIDWIQSRFAKGRPATLYFDEIRTPVYVECMNELVEEFFGKRRDVSGLYHCGGPRELSLYQIAQIVNRVGDYDPTLLIGCPRIEAGPVPPRAGNVTMDSSALSQLIGREPFVPWPLMSSMVPDNTQWHNLRPGTEMRSPDWLQQTLYRRPSGNVRL